MTHCKTRVVRYLLDYQPKQPEKEEIMTIKTWHMIRAKPVLGGYNLQTSGNGNKSFFKTVQSEMLIRSMNVVQPQTITH